MDFQSNYEVTQKSCNPLQIAKHQHVISPYAGKMNICY